jgi:formylglycine-generating enzyme required for sulfatase activity
MVANAPDELPIQCGSLTVKRAPQFAVTSIETGNLTIKLASDGTVTLIGKRFLVPAGSLSINDVSRGEIPIHVEYADGETEDQIVTVVEGQTATVDFAYKVRSAVAPTLSIVKSYGSIAISSSSPGTLYLDGTRIGDLPGGSETRLDDIEEGERSLEMKYGTGNKETVKLAVERGKAALARFTWSQDSVATGGNPEKPQVRPLLKINAGHFMMGSPAGENRQASEVPLHDVNISSFVVGQYLVTQAEWKSVMGANPSRFTGKDDRPVEQVSWYDCLVYCNKRSLKEGLTPVYRIVGSTDPANWGETPTFANDTWNAVKCDFKANGYRLPTEAEWEYACRAGTNSASPFGADITWHVANFDGQNPYPSNVIRGGGGNSMHATTVVGTYKANPWGLYDAIGNVWEWCWDWYDDHYYSKSPAVDPRGPASGVAGRVLRGGAWDSSGEHLRAGNRFHLDPSTRKSDSGLRIVCGQF